MQHCKFFSCPLHFMNILTCWYNIELWVHTHTSRRQKASVLSMRNAIQPNLNKTQPLVPDLSMHTEYSRLSCVALPLREKATLNDCDYLHSAQHRLPLSALTTLEDVLMTASASSWHWHHGKVTTWVSQWMSQHVDTTCIPCFIKIGNQ